MHLATWRATTRRATAQRRRAAANSPRTPTATFRMAERRVLARAGPLSPALRRAREVELQAAQAELAAAGRELRITHQQRLLEVARQQGELEEQLSLAHAERDRTAGEVTRAPS